MKRYTVVPLPIPSLHFPFPEVIRVPSFLCIFPEIVYANILNYILTICSFYIQMGSILYALSCTLQFSPNNICWRYPTSLNKWYPGSLYIFTHVCLPRSLLYEHTRISETRPFVVSLGQLPTFCFHKQCINDCLCTFISLCMHEYIHS